MSAGQAVAVQGLGVVADILAGIGILACYLLFLILLQLRRRP